MRRGAPSANSRWGNSVAILIGDYLFARAADIAAELGPEAVRIQARTFARLVHGQIAETVGPREGDDPIEHYLHVIAEKTGSLIATSARFGGMFGGAPPAHVEALAAYGETIGIAFQLSDDLLDIACDVGAVGQDARHRPARGRADAAGALRAGRRRRATPPSVRLREILAAGPVTDDALHAEALGLLRESPALKRARETVRGYAERGPRRSCAPLPDGAGPAGAGVALRLHRRPHRLTPSRRASAARVRAGRWPSLGTVGSGSSSTRSWPASRRSMRLPTHHAAAAAQQHRDRGDRPHRRVARRRRRPRRAERAEAAARVHARSG